MSPPERLLWSRLRGHQGDGLKFRRQHPLGPYVLDFYCHEARLALEVDGTSHIGDQAAAHDAKRDAYLARQGVRTVRIAVSDIYEDLEEVLVGIAAEARRS